MKYALLALVAGCGSVNGSDATPDAPDDTMPAPEFLSCAGMVNTCGASEIENCCASPMVPGGSYNRGYDLAGDADSGATTAPATLAGFRLDRYEVTVGRFRVFANTAGLGTQMNPPAAGAGAHARVPNSGWDAAWNASLTSGTLDLSAKLHCQPLATWTDSAAANEHRPINCVTWYEAMAFCIWDGGYLPTEAEWNFAATGGDQQRAYPWSAPATSLTISPANASYSTSANTDTCDADGDPACTVADLISVGSKPAGDGRWGHSDLGGNVFEWLLDASGDYPTPCEDCANLAKSARRTLRGGGANSAPRDLRTGIRNSSDPTMRIANLGFRCARR